MACHGQALRQSGERCSPSYTSSPREVAARIPAWQAASRIYQRPWGGRGQRSRGCAHSAARKACGDDGRPFRRSLCGGCAEAGGSAACSEGGGGSSLCGGGGQGAGGSGGSAAAPPARQLLPLSRRCGGLEASWALVSCVPYLWHCGIRPGAQVRVRRLRPGHGVPASVRCRVRPVLAAALRHAGRHQGRGAVPVPAPARRDVS